MEKATGTVWAIKEMSKEKVTGSSLENLKGEVKIGAMLGSHPHIVRMKEFVENADRYHTHPLLPPTLHREEKESLREEKDYLASSVQVHICSSSTSERSDILTFSSGFLIPSAS